jgi:hypothetical protein
MMPYFGSLCKEGNWKKPRAEIRNGSASWYAWQAFQPAKFQTVIRDVFVINCKTMHKDELAKKPTRIFSYTHHSNPQVLQVHQHASHLSYC